MTEPRAAAIVLAAGASTRMGGDSKLLATLQGEPLVRRAVKAAVEGGADPVIVVTGDRAEAVEAVVPATARCVRNPAFEAGLATSLQCGIEAVPTGSDAIFVALGDMPFVRAEHYTALRAAWRPGSIVAPTYAGRRGHPVLWSASFFDRLRTLRGDRGARDLLTRHADQVVEVPVDDAGILFDVDRPEDLDRAREHG